MMMVTYCVIRKTPFRNLVCQTALQNIVYNVSFIVLEFADFLGLAMEPIFKVLPILGLLYVLVPYYNQFKEGSDFDDEDDEFGNESNDVYASAAKPAGL